MDNQAWNPVGDLRKKYSGLKSWTDDQILESMEDPSKFRSAFPEYSHLNDGTIKRNVQSLRKPKVSSDDSRSLLQQRPSSQGPLQGVYEMVDEKGNLFGSVPYGNVESALQEKYSFKDKSVAATYRKDLEYGRSNHPSVTPEGVFELVGPDGKTKEKVAYSQVLDKVKNGYIFSDEKNMLDFRGDLLWQYNRDRDNSLLGKYSSWLGKTDPKIQNVLNGASQSYVTPSGLSSFQRFMHERNLDPVTGLLKTGAGLVSGVQDIVTRGENWIAGSEAPDTPAVKALRSFSQSKDASELEQVGKLAGETAEFIGGEEVLGALESGGVAALQKIPSLAKMAPKIAEIASEHKKIASVMHWGYEAAKQGMVAGVQNYIHTQDEQSAKRAFLVAGAAGAAFSAGLNGLIHAPSWAKEKFYKSLTNVLSVSEYDVKAIVNKVVEDNEKALNAYKEKHEAKVGEANLSQKEFEEETLRKQKDLEAATNERTEKRKNVLENITSRYKKAKSKVNEQFNAVRSAIGPATIPMEMITDAVSKAKDLLKGSEPSISEFESIIKQARDTSASAVEAEKIAKKSYQRSYSELSDQEKKIVDEVVSRTVPVPAPSVRHEELARELYVKKYENLQPSERENVIDELEKEGIETPGGSGKPPEISFDDLRGFWTELYAKRKGLAGPGKGDVYRAITHVMDEIDKASEEMASNANVGDLFAKARKDFLTTYEAFRSPRGVYRGEFGKSQKPNPISVAMADAMSGRDYLYSATKGFLHNDFNEQEAIINDFVGNPGDIHYDPESRKLIDELKASEEKVKEAQSRRITPPKKAPEFNPPKEKKVTPQTIEMSRRGAARKSAETFGSTSRFQIAMIGRIAVDGLVKGILGHPTAGIISALAWLKSPKVIAGLLERPEIIRKLSQVTAEDMRYLVRRNQVSDEVYKAFEEAVKSIGKIAKERRQPDPMERLYGALAIVDKVRRDRQSKEEEQISTDIRSNASHVLSLRVLREKYPDASAEEINNAIEKAKKMNYEVVE